MPNHPRRAYSKRLSRQLRNKMTDPEVILWSYLKGQALGTKFRRQVPIGRFIVDFACYEHRLVIEVDGHLHRVDDDARRDAWIESRGWLVVRYWAGDIFYDLDAVLEGIENLISPR